MKNILYILFVAGFGYYVYQSYYSGSLTQAAEQLKRAVAPAQIPSEFHGRYAADVFVNANSIRAEQRNAIPTRRLYPYAGISVIEIGPGYITVSVGRNKTSQSVKPLEAGQDYVDVEIERPGETSIVRCRISKDAGGIWISSKDGDQEVRERFRKIN